MIDECLIRNRRLKSLKGFELEERKTKESKECKWKGWNGYSFEGMIGLEVGNNFGICFAIPITCFRLWTSFLGCI